MEIVINKCYGGFGLSDKAYKRLIELGVPVKRYIGEHEGKVIFDEELTPKDERAFSMGQRYWETWLSGERTNLLLVQVVKELGEKANARHAELGIIEIPDSIKYTIEEYDGIEHVAEEHRTWF